MICTRWFNVKLYMVNNLNLDIPRVCMLCTSLSGQHMCCWVYQGYVNHLGTKWRNNACWVERTKVACIIRFSFPVISSKPFRTNSCNTVVSFWKRLLEYLEAGESHCLTMDHFWFDLAIDLTRRNNNDNNQACLNKSIALFSWFEEQRWEEELYRKVKFIHQLFNIWRKYDYHNKDIRAVVSPYNTWYGAEAVTNPIEKRLFLME